VSACETKYSSGWQGVVRSPVRDEIFIVTVSLSHSFSISSDNLAADGGFVFQTFDGYKDFTTTWLRHGSSSATASSITQLMKETSIVSDGN
jgi:hypothetical protein